MATKTTLVFKSTIPKLKYLKPEPTTMQFTFSVDSSDVNPLFLQEVSERVRSDYLVPLNDTWADQWKKWDDEVEKILPDLATKTEKKRQALIDRYVDPYNAEYEKQTKNIQSMAQSIGERYWAEITRQRTELRDYRLITAAKVAWKGLTLGTTVVTIVASGGTAVLSYLQALRKVYQIYSVLKDYCKSADDYQIEVYKDIEALKTSIWKREGSVTGFKKGQIKADVHLSEMEKLVSKSKKQLDKLEEDVKTLDIKVGQFHLKAGDVSKELDKALNEIDAAFSVDPTVEAKQRADIIKLIEQVQQMSKETKHFTKFVAQAKKYVESASKGIKEEEAYLKIIAKGIKSGATALAKEAGEVLVRISGDVIAQRALTKETVDLAGFIDGWGDKITTGLKVVDVALKLF